MSLLAIAPDLNTRLDALAEKVQDILAAHDADFARPGAVATYLDDAVDAKDRAARLALMAAENDRPERYAEIAFVNEDTSGVERLLYGEPAEVRDRVRLYVYWGVRGNIDDVAAEARAFRSILRSQSETTPGLATLLRAEGFHHFTDEDGVTWEVEFSGVTIEDTAYRLIDHANKEFRHEAVLTLLLNGAPR